MGSWGLPKLYICLYIWARESHRGSSFQPLVSTISIFQSPGQRSIFPSLVDKTPRYFRLSTGKVPDVHVTLKPPQSSEPSSPDVSHPRHWAMSCLPHLTNGYGRSLAAGFRCSSKCKVAALSWWRTIRPHPAALTLQISRKGESSASPSCAEQSKPNYAWSLRFLHSLWVLSLQRGIASLRCRGVAPPACCPAYIAPIPNVTVVTQTDRQTDGPLTLICSQTNCCQTWNIWAPTSLSS